MGLKQHWFSPVVVALFWICFTPAHAAAPETFPLSKVKRGQTGYGLTTFQGTVPSRFQFEVLGIVRNFLPKMDIILVKSDDPKVAVSGFWQGMSGSPLFIQDKLTCAFSYGFRFNKLAIGGCTPIEYMMREGFRPIRPASTKRQLPLSATGIAPQSVASLEEWLAVAAKRTDTDVLARLGPPRQPWLGRVPRPRLSQTAIGADQALVRAAVPLAFSGLTSPAFNEVKRLMADYPLTPMRAGGSGTADTGPNHFTLGSSIGIQLMRGDVAGTATGTVSYVDKNRVLAFGHPLFQLGELYAPVAAAEVHTVLPSAETAFVIASPLRELGSLVQDRQSTIMADTAIKSRMIPMDVYVDSGKDAGGIQGEMHAEILNNRFMTGSLAGVVALSAISRYLPDRDHATVYMESAVYLRDYEPLRFVDYLYTAEGAGRAIGGARGLRVLVPLLMNPFKPVHIERIELRATIRYQPRFGEISDLRFPDYELKTGRTYVDVTLTTYNGSEMIERVPYDVPAHLAGSIVRVIVTAGDNAGADVAPPKNFDDLLASFRKLLPGNTIAVSIWSADEGVAIDGKLVRDVPASALDKLYSGAATPRASVFRPAARSVTVSSRVIDGQASRLLKVADP